MEGRGSEDWIWVGWVCYEMEIRIWVRNLCVCVCGGGGGGWDMDLGEIEERLCIWVR